MSGYRKSKFFSPSLIIFIISITTYGFFLIHDFDNFGGPRFFTGDEPHYIIQTQNLIENHSFFMEQMYGSPTLNPWVNLGLDWHVDYNKGNFTANHGWGLPIIMAIPYLLGGIFGAMFSIVILASCVNVLIFKITSLVTKKSFAFYTSIIFGFCTLIFPYSKQVYSDLIMGLVVLFVLYSIFKKDFDAKKIIFSGFLLGFGLFLKNDFAIIALILFCAMIISLIYYKKKKLLTTFLIMNFGIVALYFTYNYVLLGNFSSVSMNYFTLGNPLDGLGRLFFDRYNGLVIFSPIVFFSIIGIHPSFKKYRTLMLTVIVIVLVWIISHSFVYGYGWGQAYPVRYFTTIIPLASIPFAVAFELYNKKWAFRIPTIIFSVIGFYLGISIAFDRWVGLQIANLGPKSELLSRTYFGFENIFPALYGETLWSYNWQEASIWNITFILSVIFLTGILIFKPILIRLKSMVNSSN